MLLVWSTEICTVDRVSEYVKDGTAGRAIMGTVKSSGLVLLLLGTVGGCQSWSQINPAIPTGARVPPPGTGTYPVQNQYYNAPKTGAVTQPSNVQTASATMTQSSGTPQAPVVTAAWQPPSVDQLRNDINNTAGAAFQNVTNRANQVVQAGTARAADAAQRYTDPLTQVSPSSSGANAVSTASYAGPGLSASRSLSDSGEGAALDWQPPR